jgi:hypothetical protein
MGSFLLGVDKHAFFCSTYLLSCVIFLKIKRLQAILMFLMSGGIFILCTPQAHASRECVVHTTNQFKYSFNSLYTQQQKAAISQFIRVDSLNEESLIIDLRYLGEHQCEFAVIVPNGQVRWPTDEDVEFAENLKPEDWFYIENNPKQRYYLLPRGVYTETLSNPVR